MSYPAFLLRMRAAPRRHLLAIEAALLARAKSPEATGRVAELAELADA